MQLTVRNVTLGYEQSVVSEKINFEKNHSFPRSQPADCPDCSLYCDHCKESFFHDSEINFRYAEEH